MCRSGGTSRFIDTDDGGEATFDDVPYDGTAVVEADSPTRGVRYGPRVRATVRGPTTVLTCEARVRVTVAFRDAATGEVLPDVRFRVRGAGGRAPAEMDPERSVPIDRSSRVDLGLEPEAPEGYVAFDGLDARGTVSRRAGSLLVVAPLRREANVWLRAIDVAGAEVEADAVQVEVAGHLLRRRVATRSEGRLQRVLGVPHLPHEWVRILAQQRGHGAKDETSELSSDIPHVRAFDDDFAALPDGNVPDGAWLDLEPLDPGLDAIAKGRLPECAEWPLVVTAVFDPNVIVDDYFPCLGLGFG